MKKIYPLFLCFVFNPIANANLGFDSVFDSISKKLYVLYRIYWNQDIELDYNIKNYLETVIQQNDFVDNNDIPTIDVDALRENEGLLKFYDMLCGYPEKRYSGLLYKFYDFGYLPRNENAINAFLSVLNVFIQHKKRESSHMDIPYLRILLREQAKVRTVLRSL